jgi:hypothetical protein
MRLKRIKDFIINKLPIGVESWAWSFVWIFGMVLAILTVVTVLPLLTSDTRLPLLIALILFLIATTIVFIFEARRRFLPRSTAKQGDKEISANTERSSRNKWISIGLLVLVAIILVAIFVPRQLQLNSQGYQTFYMAFAAIGAWVTGIALAVFAYQQYKLRQTEHRLLFEPRVLLTSTNPSITSSTTHDYIRKPYQIKWIVFIQNTSQIPALIEHMEVYVKLAGQEAESQACLTPTYCHVAEPEDLITPFEVTLTKSQRITWIVEGSVGDTFDYVSGDGNKRDFVLIFKVLAKNPKDPKGPFLSEETTSWPIYVPQDANWISKTPFLDAHEKQD